MDIDHSTTCDVTPAAEEGHNNPLTPQRLPFRCLTPIGANASPTLSEGFIREYLSPGTIYTPGLRYSNTPITRENSPALAAVSAGVGSSLCVEVPGTSERPQPPSCWPSPAEGETSSTWRLRWVNDFVPHIIYKSSSQRQTSDAIGTLQPMKHEFLTEEVSFNDGAPGPRTPDRHARSRWLTPAEGNASPTLRESFPRETDDIMSMSDDDLPGSVKGLCTSEGKDNGWEPAEILQLGPIEVETSRAFGDNSTRDVDISHARVPEGRKGGRMTDEEFFRFDTPGPGYRIARLHAPPSAVPSGSIINNHTTIMHHHCESVDAVDHSPSPSVTRGRRNSRAGSLEIELCNQGHVTDANLCSQDEHTTISAVGAIKKEITTSPVEENHVQTLVHESAHQPAHWTPTPQWISHIPGTDIVIQRGPRGVSGTETSPTRTRRNRTTARRSRPFNRLRDRTAGHGHLDTTAFDSAGPLSAITTRRRMVTSPTKRRQVAGRGHITHADSGVSKTDDIPEEDDDEDGPEDELDCNENNLHDLKH